MDPQDHSKTSSKKRGFKKPVLFFFFFILYLISTVPIGLFLYSLKSKAGLNVFSKTGFHSYMYCLKEQARRM